MDKRAPVESSSRLDRTLAALAHPARRTMLARLAQGQASATELGALVAVSQPAVSKHLKVLEAAGLITRGRDAQWRPCELRADALDEVEEWMAGFRRSWEGRLDRLDRYIRQSSPGPRSQPQPPQERIAQRSKERRAQRPGGGAGR
jgi:DNA-binding transcriptional ArsR family regulator